MHTTYQNGIENGGPISTSPAESIRTIEGVIIAETKNSYYVLI